MKLRMILGLLLAGSLFVGTDIQAQDNDLTAEELDALEQAQEAVEKATTAEERQKTEENLQQLKDELHAGERLALVPGVGNVTAVTVDCNDDCNREPTLGRICRQVGVGFRPFAVDCRDVDGPNEGFQQCLDTAMTCRNLDVRSDQLVGDYCEDTRGRDAHVFCVRPE
jgi:hypothetical protein